MEEKDYLEKQRKESVKRLSSVRRTWFLWIWLGYSGFIFYLFVNSSDLSGFEWFGEAIVSLIAGAFFYFVNAIIWSNCCRDINSALKYAEHIEKRIKQPSSMNNKHPEKQEQFLPQKYLCRGYDELQLECLKEALFDDRLTEADIDYFLDLKEDPRLLLPFANHLKFEIDEYVEEVAREKAAKEVLDIHENCKS